MSLGSIEHVENLLRRLPDNYAVMSRSEFFAELYAFFYDSDSIVDPDPLRPGVKDWFDQNVGKRPWEVRQQTEET